MNDNIKITRVAQSKIQQTNFKRLSFGSVFTDHMMVCHYENGNWKEVQIKPYSNICLDPSAKIFHYGQSIFEGMKAYREEATDQIWLFRPEENWQRMNKSAVRLCMPEIPKKIFFDGLETLLNLDKNWIQKTEGSALYIRPFMIATEAGVAANPAKSYHFFIICAPVKSYFSGEIRVLFEERYSRSANGGVGFAKFAGNYAGQFYPTALAQEKGFQQVVWMDADTHQNLEEAGTMHVFFRVGDKLLTTPTSDRILDGITRKSILQWLNFQNIEYEVRTISANEIEQATKQGKLLEMFGAGTAAVISPIRGFHYKENTYELPQIKNSYADKIKKAITDIQTKKAEDIFGWTRKVRNLLV